MSKYFDQRYLFHFKCKVSSKLFYIMFKYFKPQKMYNIFESKNNLKLYVQISISDIETPFVSFQSK